MARRPAAMASRTAATGAAVAEPEALRGSVERGRREIGNGREGAHPGAELEFAEDADEAGEVAAGAGRAREVVDAGRGLVPVPGDREFDGVDADGFEPDELALPERARVEVVREFDGVDELARGGGGRSGD